MMKNLLRQHKKVINKLKSLLNEGDFYLAGGTALFYYLEHRSSIDLDFFTKKNIDFRNFRDYFLPQDLKLISKDTIHLQTSGVNVSFFLFPYPLIKKVKHFDSINLASIEDILCMKINAIISRGSKKDFVDVYFIMKDKKISSYNALQFFKMKFGNYNDLIIRKSMTYFEDAEKEPHFPLLRNVSWASIKKFITTEFSKL